MIFNTRYYMNKLLLSGLALLVSGYAAAQGTTADYNRAYALRKTFNAKQVHYSQVNPSWNENGNFFWYVRNTPEGPVYVKVDAKKQQRSQLFDHKKLANALAGQSGKKVDEKQLPIQNCKVTNGMDTLFFSFNGTNWCYDIARDQLVGKGKTAAPGKQRHWMEIDDEKSASPVPSPNGKYVAFIKNDNVYVKEVATGQEKQLSILIFHQLVAGWNESRLLPHPSGRETVRLLRGVLTYHPVTAYFAQTRICKAWRRADVQSPMCFRCGNRQTVHPVHGFVRSSI